MATIDNNTAKKGISKRASMIGFGNIASSEQQQNQEVGFGDKSVNRRQSMTLPNFNSVQNLDPQNKLSALSVKDQALLRLTENFVKDVR